MQDKTFSSQAFTPGLKRKEFYIVEKVRKLPTIGKVLVKNGDKVSHDTNVARTSVPGEPEIVKVAYKIGVDPSRIEHYSLKKVGESVIKNEPLAISKGFFGLSKKVCLSPCNGTIEHISKITGSMIIKKPETNVEVKAYIPGKIIKVLPKEGVVVQTVASFIQGIFGIGGETHGELLILSSESDEELTSEHITSKHSGKILVGNSLLTSNALKKAVKVGAKGIIVGGIMEKDLIEFLGYEVGIAITGHEEVGLTLILTEGFGKMIMLEKTFELLKKHEGKMASINGATQIRAGVIRPEVIIPLNLSPTSINIHEESSSPEGLIPGTTIRIIREPYFGAIGKVASLPIELKKIDTESFVRVLEAELHDGRKVIVPRANVEIIEE